MNKISFSPQLLSFLQQTHPRFRTLYEFLHCNARQLTGSVTQEVIHAKNRSLVQIGMGQYLTSNRKLHKKIPDIPISTIGRLLKKIEQSGLIRIEHVEGGKCGQLITVCFFYDEKGELVSHVA